MIQVVRSRAHAPRLMSVAALMAVLASATVALAETPAGSVIPRPAVVTPTQGVFDLGEGTVLIVPHGDAEALHAATYFADLMQRTRGMNLTVREGETAPGAVVFRRASEIAADAYRLDVTPRSAVITAGDFGGRFQALHGELARHCEQSPDATLLALIYLSAQETRMYSATHSMLVSCVVMVVAREMLLWPPLRVQRLGRAALSMNIAMTELQDQLALQTHALTAQQIAAIEDHAARSEALLRQLGVADADWLEAVRCHHHRTPGPLAKKTEAQQMARLIQRADIFGARIAPRAARWPMPVTAAMQASYYDEEHQVDEAGSALVKGLGVYPPGAFVRLASQEVGVVIRRGTTATTPRVAVVTNREGMPTGEPIPRDTAHPNWKISAPVAQRDVRVRLPLDRLLEINC